MKKKHPDLNLTHYPKINSKWVTGLNIRSNMVKLLEKKPWEEAWAPGLGKDLRG